MPGQDDELDRASDVSKGSSSVSRSVHHVAYSTADVRALDLLAPFKELPRDKVVAFVQSLDIWDLKSFKSQTGRQRAWNVATRVLPCLTWLPKYKWRKQLLKDVAAGVAVACLIVPQGLSYAAVAGLPPIYGLYTDFLPVFLYFIFGSSMYLQVGAVSVVSLLTNTCVQEITQPGVQSVALLKTAASSALKAFYAAQGNATLAAAYTSAQSAYVTADAALIQSQINTANLLAFYVGIFSFGIGFLKLGSIMNFMGPPIISGFSTAAAITIGMGQFKNIFGFGKDFVSTYPQSTILNDLITSMMTWHGELSWRATWNGWTWIGLLLVFKQLGKLDTKVRGIKVFRAFKILGPIVVVIAAILSTKYASLHLSPGCRQYDAVAGVANVYSTWADPSNYGPANPFHPVALPNTTKAAVQAAWDKSPANAAVFPQAPTTLANFLGVIQVYSPFEDNPGCVPMPKSYAPATAAKPVVYEWPKWRGLAIVGPFGGPPTGKNPDFGIIDGPNGAQLLTQAIVITLVASLESIAIAKRLAVKHKQPDLDASREYVALGICNFFGSFAGSYPISGSFSRSALNDEVGASSPVAVLTVGVCVGIALAIATTAPIFYYLPQTALSAIVISSLLGLLDFERFLWLATYDRKDAALWLIAFIGVLFAGVEIGILIAVCISLAFVVVEFVLAPMQELGAVHGHSRRAFRPISQYPDAERVPGVVILRCEAAIVFANAANVLSRLRCIVYGSDASSLANEKAAHAGTRAVILDLSNVSYVDTAFLSGFEELLGSYRAAGVLLAIANPNSNVLHKLAITHLLDTINFQFDEARDWVFLSITDAVQEVKKYEPPVRATKGRPLSSGGLEEEEEAEEEDEAGHANGGTAEGLQQRRAAQSPNGTGQHSHDLMYEL